MKICKPFAVFFCVALVLLTSSCDSLWNVTDKAEVSIGLNTADLFMQRNLVRSMNTGVNTPREIDDDEGGLTVLVSLINSETNQLVVSKTVKIGDDEFESDDDDDILQVTFEEIEIGLSVYATVEITHDAQELLTDEARKQDLMLDNTYFKARSKSAVITEEETVLSASPTIAFFLPSGGDEYIDDIGDVSGASGFTPYDPKTNINDAYNALGGKNAPEGAVIYVMDTMTYSNTGTLEKMPDVVLKRFKSSGYMYYWETPTAAGVIRDVILDGNKENITATNALISKIGNNHFQIYGTVLQNSRVLLDVENGVRASAIEHNKQPLLIHGATITGNEMVVKDGYTSPVGFYGAAVYIEGQIEFYSSLITITGNTTPYGESNIVYNPNDDDRNKASEQLHEDTRIGISPYTFDTATTNPTAYLIDDSFLLASNGSSTPLFSLDNFILDIPGSLEIVDGNLRYKN